MMTCPFVGQVYFWRKVARARIGGNEPYDAENFERINSLIKILPCADFNCFSRSIAFAFDSKFSVCRITHGLNFMVQPFLPNSLWDLNRFSRLLVKPTYILSKRAEYITYTMYIKKGSHYRSLSKVARARIELATFGL